MAVFNPLCGCQHLAHIRGCGDDNVASHPSPQSGRQSCCRPLCGLGIMRWLDPELRLWARCCRLRAQAELKLYPISILALMQIAILIRRLFCIIPPALVHLLSLCIVRILFDGLTSFVSSWKSTCLSTRLSTQNERSEFIVIREIVLAVPLGTTCL